MESKTKKDELKRIVQSVLDEIQKVKGLLENLPPFPKGERPPSPLAKLQNKLEKYEMQFVGIKQKVDNYQRSIKNYPPVEEDYIKIFSKEGEAFEVPLRLLKFSTTLSSIIGLDPNQKSTMHGIESQYIYKKSIQ